MADTLSCSGCKFYRSPPLSDRGLKVPADYGDCRIVAPQATQIMSGTCIPANAWGFPIVKGTDWCGQWVKK